MRLQPIVTFYNAIIKGLEHLLMLEHPKMLEPPC